MLACRPGVAEYQLQALIEFVFRSAGAVAPAYGSIIAGGKNACVLHYVENSETLKDGELVLIDAGCEFGSRNGGYASDITRTFPVNGKFSPAQRELYELVLASQIAAIKAAKPGARLIHVHQAAERVLRRGLIKLGILPPTASARATRSKKSRTQLSLADLYMHGTSHWMGIDVHDAGSYEDSAANGKRASSPKRRILEAGMVFTVEPGLYIRADDKRVPAAYRGIGIRIEDDLLITPDGNEVLTSDVPKTVEEIEALMAKP
ncbi:MAG: Xaa-Pro dipeptidase [Candidatus Obscuribacterales bacterium]|nr:Xaa-Pro dipeptidase [Candidatus Obscuribacterales bacterium]